MIVVVVVVVVVVVPNAHFSPQPTVQADPWSSTVVHHPTRHGFATVSSFAFHKQWDDPSFHKRALLTSSRFLSSLITMLTTRWFVGRKSREEEERIERDWNCSVPVNLDMTCFEVFDRENGFFVVDCLITRSGEVMVRKPSDTIDLNVNKFKSIPD